eukprot:6895327-Prymnesium_polylepis.1
MSDGPQVCAVCACTGGECLEKQAPHTCTHASVCAHRGGSRGGGRAAAHATQAIADRDAVKAAQVKRGDDRVRGARRAHDELGSARAARVVPAVAHGDAQRGELAGARVAARGGKGG